MSFVASKTPRATMIRLNEYFCVFWALLLLASCTGTMSVQEARDIVIQFETSIYKPPPRIIDADIRRLLETYRRNATERPGCYEPRTEPPSDELDLLAQTHSGSPLLLLKRARSEYNIGNTTVAFRMLDAGYKNVWYSKELSRAMFMFDKARYLAETGFDEEASAALSNARSHYFQAQGQSKAHRLVGQYHTLLGQAAISFTRGDLKSAEGDYIKAKAVIEELLDSSLGLQSGLGLQVGHYFTLRPELYLLLGRTCLWEGRLNEAEFWAREAVLSLDAVLMPQSMVLYSQVLFSQRRFEEASLLAQGALDRLHEMKLFNRCLPRSAFVRAQARTWLARSFLARGMWAEALDQFDNIRSDMVDDDEIYKKRFNSNRDWGLALLMVGDFENASHKLDEALNAIIARHGGQHYDAAETRCLTAILQLKTGNEETALGIFQENLPILFEKGKEHNGETPTLSDRHYKLALIIQEYLGLVQKRTANDPGNQAVQLLEEAFSFAAAAQYQKVGKALANSSVRAEASDSALAELIRRRQDLEVRVGILERRISGLYRFSEMLENSQKQEALSDQLWQLKDAIEVLDTEIQKSFPEYESTVNPGIITTDKIRENIKSDEALVFISTTTDYTYLWALRKNGPIYFNRSELGKVELGKMIKKLRQTLEPQKVHALSDIPVYDMGHAYSLYEGLLKPIEAGWKNAKKLLVVTQGPCGQLPLSVLLTEPASKARDDGLLFSGYRQAPWLAKTHSITYLPSVAALVTLRTTPKENQDNKKSFAGFGDPIFSPNQTYSTSVSTTRGLIRRRATPTTRAVDTAQLAMLPPLPETAEEVMAIAEALGADSRRDVFLGEKASEHLIKTMKLDDRTVLVFATHGLVPGDLDGLHEAALALSSPQITGDESSDGLLTMGEIMGLKLKADWVVLSACNTAAADGEGAEALSGLGQAFFLCGGQISISYKLASRDYKRQGIDHRNFQANGRKSRAVQSGSPA